MKVIKIPYDLSLKPTVHEVLETYEEDCLGDISFDEIKKLIGIHCAEIVLTNLPRVFNRDYVLIVDEVGKLFPDWERTINVRASDFYNGTPYGDPIVGDVILCARQWIGYECDLAGLTDLEIIKLLYRLI